MFFYEAPVSSADVFIADRRIAPLALRWRGSFFFALCAAVVVLKLVAIYHFRADSDETQHAHVVWGWATGQLQYRDLFDNHMPLFQMLCAPLLRVLGERADILIWLRFAMLPLYALSLWCVYKLASNLFGNPTARWVTLLAAAWQQFFYTSTEFRTDDLWAALWLASLAVLICGRLTKKRAFLHGLLLGLAFAVSLKTVALALALAAAAAIALALVLADQSARFRIIQIPGMLAAMLSGLLIAPAATAAYFAYQGAFWIMYYCVIQHNLVPGLRSWGRFPLLYWTFPLSVPLLAAYAFFVCHRAADKPKALRTVIVILTPLLYLALLVSYWPEVTREDALPYAPLLPLVPIPLLLLLRGHFVNLHPLLGAAILPLLGVADICNTWETHNLRQNRLGVTIHSITDVLLLPQPGDNVMDDKGDYIFRTRPCYWVFEPMTLVLDEARTDPP